MVDHLLRSAREQAGLSLTALAEAAGTSRPTLSAYEHGRKSPTLATAARILGEAGFELSLVPVIAFDEVAGSRGRPIRVPRQLPRLEQDLAFATVQLPLRLNWSDPGRWFNLRDRRQRSRLYEIVLREGEPVDLLTYVDGVLLIDIWDELVLPAPIRRAWHGVVSSDVGRPRPRAGAASTNWP